MVQKIWGGYIWRSFFKTPNNLLRITPTNSLRGKSAGVFQGEWAGPTEVAKQEAHHES